MRYLGGKHRTAKLLTVNLLASTGLRGRLIEPFCGGGAMTTALAPHFEHIEASDIHDDLILMWRALKRGWQPPEQIAEDEYHQLKQAPPVGVERLRRIWREFRREMVRRVRARRGAQLRRRNGASPASGYPRHV